MHKTIDFIGDLKSDGCFKWHTPSHGVQKCQKAFIFGGFQAFSMGRLCVWFGIVAALFVRFFSHFMLIHGWGKGVSNYEINAFKNTTDHEKYLFVVPLLLLAPLFEEAINRGFIYKAFRGSYSIKASMALIVAWTANTHWGQYAHSWIAAFGLSMLTIVQCYLREKSDSLWDCILCHFTFNASLLFVSA